MFSRSRSQVAAGLRLATLAIAAEFAVGCGLWPSSSTAVKSAFGEPWSKPYANPGTLGMALEDQFGYMLAACGIRTLDDHERSAVPLILQQSMRDEVNKQVMSYAGQSSWNMFRFITTGSDLSGFPSLKLDDYLDVSLIGPVSLPVPAPGSRALIHFQSCSSIVNAALKAGLAVPIATLNLALSSDYEDNTSVALVDGSFFSPVAALLNATGSSVTAVQQHRALLAVWQYLTAHNSHVVSSRNTTYSYLGGFRGVVVYTVRNAARKTDASFQGSAAVTVPVGGINALLGINMNSHDSTDVRDFTTIIFADTTIKGSKAVPQVQMVTLPSAQTINGALWGVQVTALDTTPADIGPTTSEITRRFRTYEIPPSFCDPARWYVSGPEEGGRFPQNAAVVMTAKDTTCSIAFTMDVPKPFRDSIKARGALTTNFELWRSDSLIVKASRDTSKTEGFFVGVYLPTRFVFDSTTKGSSSAKGDTGTKPSPKRPSGKSPPRGTSPTGASDSTTKKP